MFSIIMVYRGSRHSLANISKINIKYRQMVILPSVFISQSLSFTLLGGLTQIRILAVQKLTGSLNRSRFNNGFIYL